MGCLHPIPDHAFPSCRRLAQVPPPESDVSTIFAFSAQNGSRPKRMFASPFLSRPLSKTANFIRKSSDAEAPCLSSQENDGRSISSVRHGAQGPLPESDRNIPFDDFNSGRHTNTTRVTSEIGKIDFDKAGTPSANCTDVGNYGGISRQSSSNNTLIENGHKDQITSHKIENLESTDTNSSGSSKLFTSSTEIYESSGKEVSSTPSVYDEECESKLAYLLASRNVLEFVIRFPAWADAQKESGIPQRQKRAFYSNEDWLRHRSTLRYVRHMLSSLSSRVIVSLVPPVFTFTTCAFLIATYNSAVNLGIFPSFFPLLHAASLPYELTAPALALLLVFRTDASYSRYDEARKTWTTVISVTKDFARQTAQLNTSTKYDGLKASLLSYIMAFPVSLKCHLIHGSDTRKDLQLLLEEDDLAFVLASAHRPNCLIQLMSRALILLQLENTEKIQLEGNITQYNTSISVCERLIRTPIPLSYTRLTSRFLVLWHTSLPIILWDSCNWLVVPATFFSAAALFYIEEVGVLIEEPFPMLALDKIIGIAHENIREFLALQEKANEFLISKGKTSQ